jgi:hypothetical protein
MMNRFTRSWQVCILLLFLSCSKDANECLDPSDKENLNAKAKASLNAESGTKTVLYMAEYLTSSESGKLGQTVYFKNVGNKQINTDFVPGDPRRGGRVNITYTIDNQSTSDNGLTLAQTSAAIDNAMETWDAQTCSDLNMTKVPFNGDLGFVSLLFGFGGNGANVADVQHSGFLPGAFFDSIATDGSDFILGVTFTIIFVTDAGAPTDIDGDGLADVAFREIYYNDEFTWRVNSGNGIDVETVALHESGHGLSQAHFGKAFQTNSNGKLHFSPRAVMNAAYAGPQRTLLGTDNGGHCSNWSSWPSN